MKNLKRILTIMVLVFVCLSSFAVFASEEYILKKEMTYTNTKNYTLSDGFVEIMIGQKDFIDYQKMVILLFRQLQTRFMKMSLVICMRIMMSLVINLVEH